MGGVLNDKHINMCKCVLAFISVSNVPTLIKGVYCSSIRVQCKCLLHCFIDLGLLGLIKKVNGLFFSDSFKQSYLWSHSTWTESTNILFPCLSSLGKNVLLKNCFIWHVPLNLVACLPVSHVFLLYRTSAEQGSTYRITRPRSKLRGFTKYTKLAIQGIVCLKLFNWKNRYRSFYRL